MGGRGCRPLLVELSGCRALAARQPVAPLGVAAEDLLGFRRAQAAEGGGERVGDIAVAFAPRAGRPASPSRTSPG